MWVLPVMLAVGVASLSALRIYQATALRGFFTRYVGAPVDVMPLEAVAVGMPVGVPPSPASDRDTGEELVVVTLNAWQCGDRPSVTFRYDKAFVNDDFTRTFTLAQRSPVAQPTRIFAPVYSHFIGVEFSDTRAGCIGSVARVRDLKAFTLLVPSVLPPDWEHEKLYQRFKTWPWTSVH